MSEIFTPKPTIYADCEFRSRIEARWAIVFDQLDIGWEYELKHYDLGLKNAWDWESIEAQLEEDLDNAWDGEERDQLRREAWFKKHEKRFYLPDFYLYDFDCWIEIKGKSPTLEEEIKARKLAKTTGKPVHVLWGYIPDPQAKIWGECSEVYGTSMGIITSLVLEYGLKAVTQAFTWARLQRHWAT